MQVLLQGEIGKQLFEIRDQKIKTNTFTTTPIFTLQHRSL